VFEVAYSFDPGALLSRVYRLPSGQRVRLRLVQRRDEHQIRALLTDRGHEHQDLDVMRIVRFDPRRRAVICATTLVGSTETVIGLGAIELDSQPSSEPDLLISDGRIGEGLDELLVGALRGHAHAIARARRAA
jgi:hypothetical protein